MTLIGKGREWTVEMTVFAPGLKTNTDIALRFWGEKVGR
jgi:hypothetical protein